MDRLVWEFDTSVWVHVLSYHMVWGTVLKIVSDVVGSLPSKQIKTQKPDLYERKHHFLFLSFSLLHHIESHSWTSQFSNQSKFTFFKRLHSKKSICVSCTTRFVIQRPPKIPWTKVSTGLIHQIHNITLNTDYTSISSFHMGAINLNVTTR